MLQLAKEELIRLSSCRYRHRHRQTCSRHLANNHATNILIYAKRWINSPFTDFSGKLISKTGPSSEIFDKIRKKTLIISLAYSLGLYLISFFRKFKFLSHFHWHSHITTDDNEAGSHFPINSSSFSYFHMRQLITKTFPIIISQIVDVFEW